jgi:hypothetical protein
VSDPTISKSNQQTVASLVTSQKIYAGLSEVSIDFIFQIFSISLNFTIWMEIRENQELFGNPWFGSTARSTGSLVVEFIRCADRRHNKHYLFSVFS